MVVGVVGLQGDDVLHERDGAGHLAPLGEERREVEHGGDVVRLEHQALAEREGGSHEGEMVVHSGADFDSQRKLRHGDQDVNHKIREGSPSPIDFAPDLDRRPAIRKFVYDWQTFEGLPFKDAVTDTSKCPIPA